MRKLRLCGFNGQPVLRDSPIQLWKWNLDQRPICQCRPVPQSCCGVPNWQHGRCPCIQWKQQSWLPNVPRASRWSRARFRWYSLSTRRSLWRRRRLRHVISKLGVYHGSGPLLRSSRHHLRDHSATHTGEHPRPHWHFHYCSLQHYLRYQHEYPTLPHLPLGRGEHDYFSLFPWCCFGRKQLRDLGGQLVLFHSRRVWLWIRCLAICYQ